MSGASIRYICDRGRWHRAEKLAPSVPFTVIEIYDALHDLTEAQIVDAVRRNLSLGGMRAKIREDTKPAG